MRTRLMMPKTSHRRDPFLRGSQRRNDMQRQIAMLRAAIEPTLKVPLMKKTSIPHYALKPILDRFIDTGSMKATNVSRFVLFQTTKKGVRILKAYDHLMEML